MTNKEKYKSAFSVLHTSGEFQMEAKEMKRSKWLMANSFISKFAVVACAVVLCTGGVFAAGRFLSTAEVAHEIGDSKLEGAFKADGAVEINETQSFGDYDVTLLGMVSGKDLTESKMFNGEGEFLSDRTYVVTAIEKKDGQDISFDDSFFVSPLIDGYNPAEVNIATLYGGFTAFIPGDNPKVMYHIADMENIEPFADHKIHLAVQEGGFFDNGNNGDLAYNYDEATGAYTRNENYDGVNAFFNLPVDASKADAGKAAEILAMADEDVMNTDDTIINIWAEELTSENLTDLAKPIAGTKQKVSPNAEGIFTVGVHLDNGYAAEFTDTVDNMFGAGKPGAARYISYSLTGNSTDGTDADIYAHVFTLNEDGTVTFELWEKK